MEAIGLIAAVPVVLLGIHSVACLLGDVHLAAAQRRRDRKRRESDANIDSARRRP